MNLLHENVEYLLDLCMKQNWPLQLKSGRIMRLQCGRRYQENSVMKKMTAFLAFFSSFFLFNLRVMLFPYKIGHKIKIE